MENRYTESALNALSLARESAYNLRHGFIGTEHILMGLIKGMMNQISRIGSKL